MDASRRQEVNMMTEGSIRKKMLLFAVPVFLGNLFQQLYNTADSLIVGNCLGEEELAAVTSTGSLIYLIIGLFNGLAMGAGTVIARHLGAGEKDRASKAVHTAVALGLVCGAAVSVLGYYGAGFLLRLMRSPENVRPISTRYLSLYFAGSFFVVMYNVFVGILQAGGDSRHPLYYLAASSVINVLLDLTFIRVLGMDVEGAAIATVISQAFSCVLAGIRLYRSRDVLRLEPKKVRFDRESLGNILHYGVPTGAQVAVIDISNVLIQSFINSFGSAAMAGLGAYSKVEGFTFLPVTAFQMAIGTFVSQNMGAKKYERARRGILFGVASTVILSEVIGVIVAIFARPILRAFIRGGSALTIGYGMKRALACAPFMLMPAYAHAMSAVMRGIGKPMAPMVVMLCCWCAVRVTLLYTVGLFWKNILLICWVYPFTWLLSTVAYTVYVIKLRKEFPWLRLSKTEHAE